MQPSEGSNRRPDQPGVELAASVMQSFAERTGLTSTRPERRYLWTDAFAVLNFLELTRRLDDPRYKELALVLIERVHRVLGRHRPDDSRRGFISGLSDAEGEEHPTRGGLRIGKALPERGPKEPFDDRAEWDRDGQYFHYLTQWMRALDRAARETGSARFNRWGGELAAVAVRAFSTPTHGRRLVWKMSVDLTRPLVSSTGQHDALDGFVTVAELRATASDFGDRELTAELGSGLRLLSAMDARRDWVTDDPLGLGGVLTNVERVAHLVERHALPDQDSILGPLLDAAAVGVERFAATFDPGARHDRRLAFRELGFSIGLRAIASSQSVPAVAPRSAVRAIRTILRHAPLGGAIEDFWREPTHRRAVRWMEHQDINEVMFATTLLAAEAKS